MWVSRGVLDALRASREETQDLRREQRTGFERTLAVLREENSTLRRLCEQTAQRADALTAETIRALVAQSAPLRPVMAERPDPPARSRTSRHPIPGLGNVLDPVPLGDPNGTFASEADASLLFPTTAEAP
jgi:hypothetical protein